LPGRGYHLVIKTSGIVARPIDAHGVITRRWLYMNFKAASVPSFDSAVAATGKTVDV